MSLFFAHHCCLATCPRPRRRLQYITTHANDCQLPASRPGVSCFRPPLAGGDFQSYTTIRTNSIDTSTTPCPSTKKNYTKNGSKITTKTRTIEGGVRVARMRIEDTNPLCGDVIRLELQVDDQGTLKEVYFNGDGCCISQAAASMLVEKFDGKSR